MYNCRVCPFHCNRSLFSADDTIAHLQRCGIALFPICTIAQNVSFDSSLILVVVHGFWLTLLYCYFCYFADMMSKIIGVICLLGLRMVRVIVFDSRLESKTCGCIKKRFFKIMRHTVNVVKYACNISTKTHLMRRDHNAGVFRVKC